MKGIHYLTRQQINIEKWDQCISDSPNGLVYAYSFYLDTMAKNWDALVLEDYAAVMPLTWNEKYRIYYLYQPAFTASLGLFGKNISARLLKDFLNAIPAKFKYWDLSFNHGNYFTVEGFEMYERTNYVLDLQNSYDILAKGYRENVVRNIKKSKQLKDNLQTEISIEEIIGLAQSQLTAVTQLQKEDFKKIKELFNKLDAEHLAKAYGIRSVNGQLLASAVFFFSNKRAYYILVGNHPNSKATGASHALIDAFIKDHAGQDLLLDFEGSDIRNLAFFYSSFGAREEKYPAIKLNKLPKLLSWLKP